jgi:lysophospholipase L1-like esterase
VFVQIVHNTEALKPVLDRFRAQELVVIAAIGDSNTCNATFTAGAKQWPELLHSELRCHYKTQRILLVNAGMCGDTVAGGNARLERDVLRFQPTLTIITFGTNDSKRATPGQFEEGLERMVDRVTAVGSLAMIRTSPPVMEVEPAPPHIWRDDGARWRLMDINRDVAARRGLALVDIQRAWRDMEQQRELRIETLMHDCVHPNALGHQLMARQTATAFGLPPTFHWERVTQRSAEEESCES